MALPAIALKEQGNKAFQIGNYKEAEVFYTRAIQRDPSNAILYTNRAFSRIKLSSWNACIDDCIEAIRIQPDNMKGYYYLAQAQLALNHPNEALSSGLTAYDICLRTNNASASSISTLVLQAKKEKWASRERERLWKRNGLLRELEDGLNRQANYQLDQIEQNMEELHLNENDGLEEKADVETELRRKIEELRTVFALADPANMTRREVPDYLIDDISFAIMLDPVVTMTGNSYDRTTILEHLRRSETDPLTREPLRREDLRPNLALKQASAEFLEANGWAVDW